MQLDALIHTASHPPGVNQCEMHIGLHDDVTRRYCENHGIAYQAYSPLGGYPGAEQQAKPRDAVSAMCLKNKWCVETAHNDMPRQARDTHE